MDVSRALNAVRTAVGLPLPPTNRHVIAAIEYMSARRAASLPVHRIAAAIGVSAGRLAHLFQDELQLPVHEYLIRTRVEATRYLLVTTGKPLGEIASLVGFSDAGHLSRVFARYIGCRPQQYRTAGFPLGPIRFRKF